MAIVAQKEKRKRAKRQKPKFKRLHLLNEMQAFFYAPSNDSNAKEKDIHNEKTPLLYVLIIDYIANNTNIL